jgi:hypothetical protein
MHMHMHMYMCVYPTFDTFIGNIINSTKDRENTALR